MSVLHKIKNRLKKEPEIVSKLPLVTLSFNLNNSADYNGLFNQAFNKEPGMETIGMAIASYERTLNLANSPFYRWYYGKDKKALDDIEQSGFQLSNGKANCSGCHAIKLD